MPFQSDETSVASGAPIELYVFTGTFKTWRLTTSPTPIVNALGTFLPVEGLKRGNLKNASQEQGEIVLDIKMPFDFELIADYVFDTAPPELYVEIYRLHRTALNDYQLIWTGKPTNFSVEDFEATLRCPSMFSYLLAGLCPSPKYQGPCNHILYDERCQVARAANAQTMIVTDISSNGTTITVDANTFTAGHCIAGEMVWEDGGQRRMIISNSGNTFNISSRFSGLAIGSEIECTRGCDHSFTMCKNRFSNGINFGGFPFIPQTNPFRSRL